jgi:hypothetical protein
MVEIYSNDSLKIIQDKNNKTIYNIVFFYKNTALIRSLTKSRLIQGSTTIDDYSSIRFKALSVTSLSKYIQDHKMETGSSKLSINIAAKMVSDLTKQLNYLIKNENSTILGYNVENIIVIDGETFAFLGSDLVTDINVVTDINEEMLMISTPFTHKDFFIAPELFKINELPSYVHFKVAYFSLGCLILYALFSDDEFYTEYLKHQHSGKIQEYLDSHHIKNTKLYWLLSRCLVEDPKNRSILFI